MMAAYSGVTLKVSLTPLSKCSESLTCPKLLLDESSLRCLICWYKTLNCSKLLAKFAGMRKPSVASSKFSACCHKLGDGEIMLVFIFSIGSSTAESKLGFLFASETIYWFSRWESFMSRNITSHWWRLSSPNRHFINSKFLSSSV